MIEVVVGCGNGGCYNCCLSNADFLSFLDGIKITSCMHKRVIINHIEYLM